MQPEEELQHPTVQTEVTEVKADTDSIVTWTASEYVAHDKTSLWYVGLILAVIVAASGIYLLTRSWFSSFIILLLGVVIWIYGARPPRTLEYSLGDDGIEIAGKPYPYYEFRSFALLSDRALHGVSFMPLKRFMPVLTIYFSPEDAQRITELLEQHLPVEEAHNDLLDQLAHKFRF